jgi:hypothetical protein
MREMLRQNMPLDGRLLSVVQLRWAETKLEEYTNASPTELG